MHRKTSIKTAVLKKLAKYITGSMIALSMAALGVANVAMAETLKYLSSWESTSIINKVNVNTFVANVAKYSNGAVKFDIIGPDVIGPFEQLKPLQTGGVDMLFSYPAYHAQATKIGMTADAIVADPQAWRSNGIFDAFDAHYKKMGLKVISIMPQGRSGFRFVANQAVDGRQQSFAGMKVRSIASYVPVIEKMGGIPVPLAGGQIHSAFENRIIDAAPWGAIGLMDFKIYEVADYIVQPDFGMLSLWMWMNLDKWNALDKATQDAITRAAVDTEMYTLNAVSAIAAQELADLQKNGMKITRMNDSEAKNITGWMTDGLWKTAATEDADATANIRAIAVKAGLAK